MSLSCRFLRRSVLCLLCMIPGVCAAQLQQFQSVPQVLPTGGRVTSFLTGSFQAGSTRPDFLYVNAPVGSGSTSTVAAGVELIGPVGQGFSAAGANGNQIQFTGVSNVVAALGDFNGDTITDFAFAFVPYAANSIEICIYYGTGASEQSHVSSFAPFTGKSGCETIPSNNPNPPVVSYMVAFPLQTTDGVSQLVLEDSANNALYYVFQNGVTSNNNGVLTGYVTKVGLIAGGAGPMYVGDFDGDGQNDLIINGQSSKSASVYLAANGLFMPRFNYTFDHNVHSMLVQDMDGDGIADAVVEGDNGVIEIFKGTGKSSGPFQTTSEGGTAPGGNSLAGEGGHLAAIHPTTHDILVTTPIGLSLLQGGGTLNYSLKNVYNIGPGRSSFALASVYTAGNLDLMVDSAEGVAIVAGNGDGTFQASKGYSALAPALSATVGRFHGAVNPADVVVATGATQAQLLRGAGDGSFAALAGVVDTGPGPGNVPAQVWSNVFAGDFDGDGKVDVLYSLTGEPPVQPTGSYPVEYVQYGNGDGTFAATGSAFNFSAPGSFTYDEYVNTALADLNGDGLSDFAMSDELLSGVALGSSGRPGFFPAGFSTVGGAAKFSQVATGFFKANRTSQQDLVFQQGTNFIPYKNAQDGKGKNFTAQTALAGAAAPLYASTVLLTDIDGDGNGDLVVVYYSTAANPVGAGPVSPSQVWIWYGNGDGTFAATPQVLSMSRNYYLGAVADMNGDGLSDLVLSDGSMIGILYSQGSRSFGTVQANGMYSGEQHFVAGQGINSLSLADVNGDGSPDVVVANGGVTIANPIVLGGETAASIALAQNPSDINTGGITVLLNRITTRPVKGTLVASVEPSLFGAAFTITATITSSAGVAAPTGTVTFYLDGALVGTGTLTPLQLQGSTNTSAASFTEPLGNTLPGGVHPMTAVYGGDSFNSSLPLSGPVGTHQITGSATTTTLYLCIGPTASCPSIGTLTAPAPPYPTLLSMYFGQSFNGVTGVTANDNSTLSAASVIDFNDNYNGVTTTLCVLPIGPPVVGCPAAVGTTLGTGVGTHVFTSVYLGDATHTGSSSPSVTIHVLPDTTTATLVGTPNPSPALLPVTFTATVTGNIVAPTGPIAFVFGNTLLQQTNLVPGSGSTSTATFTTSSLPVGNDLITVTYGSTLDFNAASASFTETVTPSLAGRFKLAVAPSPVTVGVGYSTLLTVTVTPVGGFAQDVTLSCANLPPEATCFFDSATIAGGNGSTNLVVATTAPHSCGSTQPYFLGANGGGVAPYVLPAMAGLLALFIPGKRRWLRALIALAVVSAATQMTGCGNCTDLGTRPATYKFVVSGAAAGSSEIEAQSVTITVAI
ncbi:MAG: FG-GAP-like repeat-containing protein [Acidobacteriota bacterium]|nr:FG-GAP-like repeat-containing protein [Acidobacteriota bacterium]